MSTTFLITNGDVVYGAGGSPAFTLNGTQKLGQDLSECATVSVNDIGFGMGISDLVGRVEDPTAMPSLLSTQITNGLTRMMSIQQNNQRLIRSNDELIGSVVQVSAAQAAPGDYVDFNFSFAVNSVTGNTMTKAGTAS